MNPRMFKGYVKTKKERREDIHEKLNAVLVDFGKGEATADDLHEVLVEIQDRWEDTITTNCA